MATNSLTILEKALPTLPAGDYDALTREWLDWLANSKHRAADTITSYEIGFRKFVAWCDAAGVQTVTDETIELWMTDLLAKGHKPSSVNTWLSGVRSFFGWAVKKKRIADDPTQDVDGIKRSDTTKRHFRDLLTDAEVRAVLDLARTDDSPIGRRDYAMLAIKAYAGARDVELQRADCADIQTRGGRLCLLYQGKGHVEKDLEKVLPPEAESALTAWLATRGTWDGPLFVSLSDRSHYKRLEMRSIRGIVKGYYKRAGVVGKDKTSHSMRHSAATSAIRNGAPIQSVADMLGHKNIQTTMIYFHTLDRLTNPAEDKINYR